MIAIYKIPQERIDVEKSMLDTLFSEVTHLESLSGLEKVILLENPELIDEVRKGNHNAPILLISEDKLSYSRDDMIELANAGISKVIAAGEIDELINAVDWAIKRKPAVSHPINRNTELQKGSEQIKSQDGKIVVEGFKNNHIVGSSNSVREMLDKIKRYSTYIHHDIFISGPNGAGKELAAKTYWDNSPRSPRWAINVAEISSELIVAELAGYKKGAFTGAWVDKKGILEEYNKGIIFLDEIGELDLKAQTQLLRILQEREIKPMASNKTFKFDIQFLLGTNKDLWEMVKSGTFREDLFYRLNGRRIDVPPLDERKDDIPILVNFFITSLNKTYSEVKKSVDTAVLETMKRFDWPGNIRELSQFTTDLHANEVTDKISINTLDYVLKISGKAARLDKPMEESQKQIERKAQPPLKPEVIHKHTLQL